MSKIEFNYDIPSDKIVAEHIPKRKHSISTTETYNIINCKKIIDRNIDTRNWIYLDEIIKSNKDLKIFRAIMIKTHDITVKIGTSDTIKKEYNISKMLNDIPGFISYLCYFNCNNNINKIINNSSICAKEGDIINVLLMKYYKLGSIKNYKWTLENFIILKSLIKHIISSLFTAYIKFGFIHNDTHFGNFLINKTTEKEVKFENIKPITLYGLTVIIMDFENSLRSNSISQDLYFIYKTINQIINNINYELNIITKNIEQINNYIQEYIISNNFMDINKLFQLIDNLEIIEIKNPNILPKYDPNVW